MIMHTTIIRTILLALLLTPMSAMAQNTVTFSYDAGGNRVSRQITVSSVKERPGETTDIGAVEEEPLEDRVRITTDAGSETVSVEISDLKADERSSVRLFTAAGALLKEVDIAGEATSVSLSPYPSGVYILSVNLSGKQHGWKISVR